MKPKPSPSIPKQRAKRAIKAVVTWANPDRLHCPLTALSSVYEPHFVLPATAEAYEQMVEQISNRCTPGRFPVPVGAMNARAALAALGINRPGHPQFVGRIARP